MDSRIRSPTMIRRGVRKPIAHLLKAAQEQKKTRQRKRQTQRPRPRPHRSSHHQTSLSQRPTISRRHPITTTTTPSSSTLMTSWKSTSQSPGRNWVIAVAVLWAMHSAAMGVRTSACRRSSRERKFRSTMTCSCNMEGRRGSSLFLMSPYCGYPLSLRAFWSRHCISRRKTSSAFVHTFLPPFHSGFIASDRQLKQ